MKAWDMVSSKGDVLNNMAIFIIFGGICRCVLGLT